MAAGARSPLSDVLVERLVDALGDRPAVRTAGRQLLSRYAEPHRRHHTARHLTEMFAALDRLVGAVPMTVPRPVTLAVLWHDAVYDPLADDNEERSAQLAEQTLAALGTAAEVVSETARLVRLTVTHRAAEGDTAGALLCDADLAVLAAAAPRYEEYARAVRQEYAVFDDAAFRAGRAAVLRELLAADHLFATDAGRELWEQAARTNLERELATLDTA